jgi:hypothetical protein
MQYTITAEAELSAIRQERRQSARYQVLLRQLCKDRLMAHYPHDYAELKSLALTMIQLESQR